MKLIKLFCGHFIDIIQGKIQGTTKMYLQAI